MYTPTTPTMYAFSSYYQTKGHFGSPNLLGCVLAHKLNSVDVEQSVMATEKVAQKGQVNGYSA